MELYSIIFYIFSFFAVTSAFLVISSSNPVHSVLWLVGCFFNIAGIFILLGAEFLAMVMVIVYVGAIAVLFLFVVMMLDINFASLKSGKHKLLPACILIALIFMADLYLVLNQSIYYGQKYMTDTFIQTELNTKSLFAENKFDIPNFEDLTNTESLGAIIYTNYFYCFQLAGVILLLAMVAAIVLTQRERRNYRKQNVTRQVNTDRKKCIEIVKVNFRQGIDV